MKPKSSRRDRDERTPPMCQSRNYEVDGGWIRRAAEVGLSLKILLIFRPSVWKFRYLEHGAAFIWFGLTDTTRIWCFCKSAGVPGVTIAHFLTDFKGMLFCVFVQ